jgi:hypothetical protein
VKSPLAGLTKSPFCDFGANFQWVSHPIDIPEHAFIHQHHPLSKPGAWLSRLHPHGVHKGLYGLKKCPHPTCRMAFKRHALVASGLRGNTNFQSRHMWLGIPNDQGAVSDVKTCNRPQKLTIPRGIGSCKPHKNTLLRLLDPFSLGFASNRHPNSCVYPPATSEEQIWGLVHTRASPWGAQGLNSALILHVGWPSTGVHLCLGFFAGIQNIPPGTCGLAS